MNSLVFLLLFFSALKYIYGSLKNIINLENMIFADTKINFYFNYLVLLLGILFLISIIGSIKKNKIFRRTTLLFVLLEIVYLFYVFIFTLIYESPLGVVISISVNLIIEISIAIYIKNNWLT